MEKLASHPAAGIFERRSFMRGSVADQCASIRRLSHSVITQFPA
jgi:hypothetical protein